MSSCSHLLITVKSEISFPIYYFIPGILIPSAFFQKLVEKSYVLPILNLSLITIAMICEGYFIMIAVIWVPLHYIKRLQ